MAHYEYSPFGKLTAKTGTYADANPFRFSSEYADDETGLVYYNYRYYSREMGRWLRRDPIEEAGGLNLYVHTANNPVCMIDKDGRFWTIAIPALTVIAITTIAVTTYDRIKKAKEIADEMDKTPISEWDNPLTDFVTDTIETNPLPNELGPIGGEIWSESVEPINDEIKKKSVHRRSRYDLSKNTASTQ